MINDQKVVAVIQVRSISLRLPGKAFAYIAGKTMIAHVIESVASAVPLIDAVVVAVPWTDYDEFNQYVPNILTNDTRIFLEAFADVGDQDVLKRVVRAAERFEADVVVRVTGDCPLWCPGIGADAIAQFADGRYDLVSTRTDHTYLGAFGREIPYSHCPDGTDVEVMSFSSLKKLDDGFLPPTYREHVTRAYYDGYGAVDIVDSQYKLPGVLSSFKLSVDDSHDLENVRQVYKHMNHDPSIPLVEAL